MVVTVTDAALRQPHPLSSSELKQLDAYWRAANYLAVGMIYLQDNPLLREALRPEHVKNRLLGHWGSPGPILHLDPCQPADSPLQPGLSLSVWSWPWGAGDVGSLLSGRQL